MPRHRTWHRAGRSTSPHYKPARLQMLSVVVHLQPVGDRRLRGVVRLQPHSANDRRRRHRRQAPATVTTMSHPRPRAPAAPPTATAAAVEGPPLGLRRPAVVGWPGLVTTGRYRPRRLHGTMSACCRPLSVVVCQTSAATYHHGPRRCGSSRLRCPLLYAQSAGVHGQRVSSNVFVDVSGTSAVSTSGQAARLCHCFIIIPDNGHMHISRNSIRGPRVRLELAVG